MKFKHIIVKAPLVIVAASLIPMPALAELSKQEPIIINATRVDKRADDIPAAVSIVGQDKIQLGSEGLGLDESLDLVPGLFFQNRYNFSQDLRASIRGFGARSSFGIRGIKIIVDGIPETLPDGQGSIDGIDIGSARQISVIRGPASSLYGNASGGAILIETEQGGGMPFAEFRITAGDYGYTKPQVKVGGGSDDLKYLVNVSKTDIEGYRDHSEFENTQMNARFDYSLSDTSSLLTTIHHTDQPIANDPGGINAADAAANPEQARNFNVSRDAGEDLKQTRIGFLYKTELDDSSSLEARFYNTTREISARLPVQPSGTIFIDRTFNGGGLKYTLKNELAGMQNRILVGLDYDRQDDDRDRYDNNSGIQGAQTLGQNELVTSLGTFVQNETKLSDELELTLGLRYDDIEFDVTDSFLGDGNDSGKVTLSEATPTVGLSFKQSDNTRLYTTISKSFETPTTTEFANPSGGGGFNPGLEPQKATNYEVGIKTETDDFRFEAAVFHIDIKDELTPFELPAPLDGRTYFENAGSSTRDGLEVYYSRQLSQQIVLATAYTYSDFKFDKFTDVNNNVFDGNRTPGLPEHKLNLDLSWYGENGIYTSLNNAYVGELFADNANTDKVDSYVVSDLRVGYNKFFKDWELESFVGVNNLFDESYNSNIRINAFGKRYYEPAPDRNFLVGVTVRVKLSD